MGTDVTWEHAASVSCVMLKAPGLSKITVKYPMNYMHSPPTTVIGTQQQHKNPQLWECGKSDAEWGPNGCSHT